VDECSAATGGGVLLTDDKVENMTMASETGCIYAMGDEAFNFYDNGKPWIGSKPAVGERIYFERYAGVVMMGRDGRMYRSMDFRQIAAGLDAGASRETSIDA